MDPETLSGSSDVPGHKLIGISGINEQCGELEGITPAELALTEVSLSEARSKVEGLLSRADELTAKVESR
ncbi:hypothetical protein ACWD8L_00390 [Streptomyces sp. NPDC005133]